MSNQPVPAKAIRKRIAKAIQQVLAEKYPHEALIASCSAYAWLGRRVIKEVLGLEYSITTGSCRWLDTEGSLVGWNAQDPLGYHAWLERSSLHGKEIVDFTSAFWPAVAARRESVLKLRPPAYVWDLASNLPQGEWHWEALPGLPKSLAESAKSDELAPLAAAASARAVEQIAKLRVFG